MSAKVGNAHEVEAMDPAAGVVNSEEVAARAYEIYSSGIGGDALDNWLRAEADLRTERDVPELHLDSEEAG